MKAYIRAMRLERWPRSLAIFVGSAAFFFLHRSELDGLVHLAVPVRLAAAFLLTWAISTANYVVNEIADAPFDVHHPTKRDRPLVRGEIRKRFFAVLGALLATAGLILAWRHYSRPFFWSMLGLLAAGFIYNLRPLRTKDIPFLDSVSESANNPIRFLIGWFAVLPQAVSPPRPPLSLLLSWWAFGNFLMVAKRLSEFRYLKDRAGAYRTSHKAYSRATLVLGMLVSALAFFAAFAYFGLRFRLLSLVFSAPVVLLFFALVFRKTLGDGELMEEPEHLLKNVPIALTLTALAFLFVLTFFLDEVGR